MTPEILDIVQKFLIGVIGIVVGAAVKIITQKGSQKKKTKDDLKNHVIFTQMHEWRDLSITTMKTGNAKKDKLLIKYATLLVNTYELTLKEVVSNAARDNQRSIYDIYMQGIKAVNDELKKQNFPQVFVDAIQAASYISKEAIVEEIKATQADPKIEYFDKLHLLLTYSKVLIDIQLNSLKDLLIKMNGELEIALDRLS